MPHSATRPFVGTTGEHFIQTTLGLIPRADRSAAEAARAWAERQGQTLDADATLAVTLHCRYVAGKGWLAKIAQQMSMAQAVLANWQDQSVSEILAQAVQSLARPLSGLDQLSLLPELLALHQHAPLVEALDNGKLVIVDELPKSGLANDIDLHIEFHGLFHSCTPQRFDVSTRVALSGAAFQAFIWQLDFQQLFKRQLEDFWQASAQRYCTSTRLAFLAACNKQTVLGNLSEQARSLAWRSAGVERVAASTRLAANGVQARLLNIYGYRSSDILCLTDLRSGLTLLYIPGSARPLHEFVDASAMHRWLAGKCRNPAHRATLLRHFRARDVDDGPFLAGLGNALKKLGTRAIFVLPMPPTGMQEVVEDWDAGIYVNYKADTYSPAIDHDVFATVTQAQRQRSLDDAEFLITSDAELTKAAVRSCLYQGINLLAPLLLVVPALLPLVVAAGALQAGLGLDEAINDKDPQARTEGLWQALFGTLNAAPGIVKGAKASKALFGRNLTGFVKPQRINGRLGYPLSPVRPPRLPDEEMAAFFEELATPGGDQAAVTAAADTLTEGTVLRNRAFGTGDTLTGQIGAYTQSLAYDAEQDAFAVVGAQAPESPRYVPDPEPRPANPMQSGVRRLVPTTGMQRAVSPASRSATLRALGIDLQLPVDFAALGSAAGMPIPKQIFSLWVGDKTIGDLYLQTLDHNLQTLANSTYRLRLYLSNANPQAFANNMALLQSRIGKGLQVSVLEHQTFYHSFRQSAYFEQYQAALDGNGGVAANYSSASDILRYRILHSEGGLYMDLDDRLLAEHDAATGTLSARIDRVSLVTPLNNLLLNSPVCNAELGMYTQYNTSMIGSHPFNPLLNQVSDEILRRYHDVEGASAFYTNPKPDPISDPQGMREYANTLNQLTGPAVLNHVIERNLPELTTLRHATDVLNLPVVNRQALFDENAYLQARQRLVPLEQVADIGNAHSWKHAGG